MGFLLLARGFIPWALHQKIRVAEGALSLARAGLQTLLNVEFAGVFARFLRQ
jgi:hypothetical protein